MLIAQITDTHIKPEGSLAYGRVDTSAFLARAVDHILHLDPRPDVVLGTGDLVDGGSVAEYQRLRHLLSPLPMPVYLIPGNHDDRDALRQVFADAPKMPRDGFIQYVVDEGPLRLIAVDTLIPGAPGGRVDAERLAWLDARLGEAPSTPTLIFMHHPPFKTAIEYMDEIGLEGADAMAEVVRRHPQVERVVCGHLHRSIQARWAGTVAMTAPATAHQVGLDIRPHAGLALSMEPPVTRCICGARIWAWSATWQPSGTSPPMWSCRSANEGGVTVNLRSSCVGESTVITVVTWRG